MHQRIGVLVIMSAAWGAAGCNDGTRQLALPPSDMPVTVRLDPVASGLALPVSIVAAPDGSERLFVVDRIGLVHVRAADGQIQPHPFLDLRAKIGDTSDGRGLYDVAFHPQFGVNGRVFIAYTAPLDPAASTPVLTTHLAELRVSLKDSSLAVPQTERTLLTIDQPRLDTESGTLAFGPEGDLYFSAAGANNDGSDTNTLRGKVLRLDVDHGDPYAIPADNPYAKGGGRPEIFASGLHAPGPLTFDLAGTRELFAVDGRKQVGLLGHTGLSTPTVYELGPRSTGVDIVGGTLYRGAAIPEMRGRFLFSVAATATESSTSRLCLASRHDGLPWSITEVRVSNSTTGLPMQLIRGFGQDVHGELYLLATKQGEPAGVNGLVLAVRAVSSAPAASDDPTSTSDLGNAPHDAGTAQGGLDASIR